MRKWKYNRIITVAIWRASAAYKNGWEISEWEMSRQNRTEKKTNIILEALVSKLIQKICKKCFIVSGLMGMENNVRHGNTRFLSLLFADGLIESVWSF